jgi:hypothetical protein
MGCRYVFHGHGVAEAGAVVGHPALVALIKRIASRFANTHKLYSLKFTA